jgi:hypothetical protein
MIPRSLRPVVLIIPLLINIALVSCTRNPDVTPTPKLELGEWLSSATQTIQTSPSPPPQTNPTPAAGKQHILIYVSPEASTNITDPIQNTLSELSKQSNLEVVKTSQINPADLTPETRLVVLFAEPSNLKDLLNAAPRLRFLALTQTNLEGAPNLVTLQTSNLRPDQIDFLAGFIAASSTPDWRIGVLAPEDSTSIRAFTNGAVFFCGLCRPPFPPFQQYPLTATISGGPENWQAAVDGLLAEGAELYTIYVAPGAESEALFKFLAEKKINIISTQPAPQGLSDRWLVSLIQADSATSLKTMWASLISPDPATPIFPSSIFQNVNHAIFSSGRQKLALNMLSDLENDAVSTGIQ